MMTTPKRSFENVEGSLDFESVQRTKKRLGYTKDEVNDNNNVEGYIIEEQCLGVESVSQLNKAAVVVDRLSYLHKHHEFSDCTVTVKWGETIEVCSLHKLVLCMSSPKFASLLVDNSDVVITDMEPPIFKIMTEYMYTDAFNVQSPEDACKVFRAAVAYDIAHLGYLAASYLTQAFSLASVWPILELVAENEQAVSLKSECAKFVAVHSSAILSHEMCPSTSKAAMMMILDMTANHLFEIDRVRAAERWAEYQCKRNNLEVSRENKRNMLGIEIMSRLRFLSLSAEQFVNICAPSNINQCPLFETEESYALLMNLVVPGSYPLPEVLPPRDELHSKALRLRLARKPTFSFAINQGSVLLDRTFAFSSPTQTALLGGKHFTLSINVSHAIVLHGIQVPTLMRPPICTNSKGYDESYVVSVHHRQNVIASTAHVGTVPYGSCVDIFFKDDIVLAANELFDIQVTTSNVYFLSKRFKSEEEQGGVRFSLSDCCSQVQSAALQVNRVNVNACSGTDFHNVPTRSDYGFVLQLVYSL